MNNSPREAEDQGKTAENPIFNDVPFPRDDIYIKPHTLIPCYLSVDSTTEKDMTLSAQGKLYYNNAHDQDNFIYKVSLENIRIKVPERLVEDARLAVNMIVNGIRNSSVFHMSLIEGRIYLATFISTGTIPDIRPLNLTCPEPLAKNLALRMATFECSRCNQMPLS
ncbi:hypothetical protein JYG34_13690 [Pseudomonas entomophila]|uniref:hypothetical protein n=1 Tax=Pseudomonas entomophila TaxID=312306 RepID=UPI001BCE4613|nr:hypothetical protein [Pseudomonas entomophila]QVM89088.1 hypothetical protein JYG34_13690 [Pseudomonas entomophila]